MKKLFSVKDRTNNKVIDNFNNKMLAKELRNKLNPERPKDFVLGSPERYYIAKGPDHRKYKS